MITLSEERIKENIQTATTIIKRVMPAFSAPVINKIVVTKARSYWAEISNDRVWVDWYNLRVSNIFEQIPDEDVAKNRLQSTIIHELIHTIPGCFNHGQKFQLLCQRINSIYPRYNLQTSTPAEDVNVEIPLKQPKLTFTCNTCGRVFNWFRKPKFEPSKYACTCGCSDFVVTQLR